MERSMGEYVKKLMEVDAKAVELVNKRETEIENLEVSFNSEVEKFKEVLQTATETGNAMREKILESTKVDMEQIKKQNILKLQKVEKYFESIKHKITEEIWQNILE